MTVRFYGPKAMRQLPTQQETKGPSDLRAGEQVGSPAEPLQIRAFADLSVGVAKLADASQAQREPASKSPGACSRTVRRAGAKVLSAGLCREFRCFSTRRATRPSCLRTMRLY